MLRDRLGHRRVLAIMQRVIAAHDALQFGEFADQPGDQVGLGQLGGAARLLGIGMQGGSDLVGQPLNAVDFLRHGAKFGMKNDVLQRRQAAFQTLLTVLVPEEFCIRQARGQHALIAGDHLLATIIGQGIGDDHEPRRQLTIPGVEREILLMRPHRGGQHLAGNIHELLRDTAQQHHRLFDQPGHLIGQAGILNQQQAFIARGKAGILQHGGAAGGKIRFDIGLAQTAQVIGGIAHGKTLGCLEAVAAGGVTGSEMAEFERHDLALEQADHRMQRPHPAQGMIPPAHRFRPGQLRQGVRQDTEQRFPGGLARLFDHGEPEFTLAGIAFLALVQRGQASATQKTLHGGIGRTDARPLLLLTHIGLHARQAFHHQRQPARRDIGGDAFDIQRGFFQGLVHQTRQILGGALLHARGNFFRMQFQEKFAQHLRRLQACCGRAMSATGRSRPWPARARGRYRRRARSR